MSFFPRQMVLSGDFSCVTVSGMELASASVPSGHTTGQLPPSPLIWADWSVPRCQRNSMTAGFSASAATRSSTTNWDWSHLTRLRHCFSPG